MFTKEKFTRDISRLSLFACIYLAVFHGSLAWLSPIFESLGLGNGQGQNGLLSLLLVTFGLGLFSVYSKGKLFLPFQKKDRKMTFKTFVQLTMCVIGCQFILVFVNPIFEWVFNVFRFSLQAANAAGSVQGIDPLIFFYGAIIAPISEEIIFRGAMQGSIEKYGRLFALVFASTIFALMHGNFTQAVFAFAVGMIFGYIAMEYSLGWAIILHLMNNLVYSEILSPLLGLLSLVVSGLMFVGSLIILFPHRNEIRLFRKENKTPAGLYRIAFTRPSFLAMVVIAVLVALSKVTVL